ncbi:hypothetical protein [Anaerosporobacter sp.]|uniref:hypothetical protein n=1 Tax=Anaerosporobacter sp. TaxID=1872529 RepID=UPI00286F6F23|nr:hypothetical protein [Anaerosporobacter sp.]
MKTINVEVKKELSDYMERLAFETNAQERIIKSLIADTSNTNLLENDNFIKYQQRYESKLAEYDIAKEEVSSMLPTEWKNHDYEWNLDFKTAVMTVTFKCNCFDEVSDEDLLKELNVNA